MSKIYRQGDVILERLDNIPRLSDEYKIAEKFEMGGETGHMHTIEAPVYSEPLLGQVIVIDVPKEMKHEEHDWLTIEPGAYQIRPVRDFLTQYGRD